MGGLFDEACPVSLNLFSWGQRRACEQGVKKWLFDQETEFDGESTRETLSDFNFIIVSHINAVVHYSIFL